MNDETKILLSILFSFGFGFYMLWEFFKCLSKPVETTIKKPKSIHYRLLQDEFCGTIFYTVQYRSLWMWWDKTEFDCCIDGSCAGDSPKQFKSIELATKFIEELYTKRKIVKLIEIT